MKNSPGILTGKGDIILDIVTFDDSKLILWKRLAIKSMAKTDKEKSLYRLLYED